MARNSKNKRDISKKSDKDSPSDQKENRPKKVKAHSSKETIPMTKQLMVKKKTVKNNVRAKRQSKSGNIRTCGNGKIMPSLEDLEKMFEDSDDDSDDNSSKLSKPLEVPGTPEKQIPMCIDPNVLFSPATCSRITQQVKEILSINSSSTCEDDISGPPPRKRLKFDQSYELDDLTSSAGMGSENVASCETGKQDNNNEEREYYHTKTNSLAPSASKEVKLATSKAKSSPTLNGNISGHSSDSDSTIEYKLNPSMLQSEPISQKFSPLPSTSKDTQTFIKNDELLNKSILESSLNSIKPVEEEDLPIDIPKHEISIEDVLTNESSKDNIKNEPFIKNEEIPNDPVIEASDKLPDNELSENKDGMDVQIIETPTETITILDEDIIKTEASDNINIYDSMDQSDDDCVFVETASIKKPQSTEADIIDLDYDFMGPVIDLDDKPDNMEDEIIDVDALIAQNQTILNQYKPESKTLDNTVLVVDVDVASISQNPASGAHKSTNEQGADLPEDSRNNPNVADSDTSNIIVSSSSIQPEHSLPRKKRKRQPQHNPNISMVHAPDMPHTSSHNQSQGIRHIIMSHVDNFFRNIYRPPENLPRVSNSFSFPFLNTLTSLLSSDRPSDQSTSNYNRQSSMPNNLTSSLLTTSHTNQHVPQVTTANFSTLQRIARTPKKKRKSPTSSSTPVETIVNQTMAPLASPQEKPSGNLGDCPICMDTLSGRVIASTICGHVFCMRCLQQAIASNKRCPTCRKIIKKNGYHQIFL